MSTKELLCMEELDVILQLFVSNIILDPKIATMCRAIRSQKVHPLNRPICLCQTWTAQCGG
eukprot:9138219-Lingulodinium_polyedra.AAC.1